ncbi:MAG: TRAP dicarboxylate transporter, DctM subunit, unknown substrate 7, partial [uncultured Acetobacteraceae bacterium]
DRRGGVRGRLPAADRLALSWAPRRHSDVPRGPAGRRVLSRPGAGGGFRHPALGRDGGLRPAVHPALHPAGRDPGAQRLDRPIVPQLGGLAEPAARGAAAHQHRRFRRVLGRVRLLRRHRGHGVHRRPALLPPAALRHAAGAGFHRRRRVAREPDPAGRGADRLRRHDQHLGRPALRRRGRAGRGDDGAVHGHHRADRAGPARPCAGKGGARSVPGAAAARGGPAAAPGHLRHHHGLDLHGLGDRDRVRGARRGGGAAGRGVLRQARRADAARVLHRHREPDGDEPADPSGGVLSQLRARPARRHAGARRLRHSDRRLAAGTRPGADGVLPAARRLLRNLADAGRHRAGGVPRGGRGRRRSGVVWRVHRADVRDLADLAARWHDPLRDPGGAPGRDHRRGVPRHGPLLPGDGGDDGVDDCLPRDGALVAALGIREL